MSMYIMPVYLLLAKLKILFMLLLQVFLNFFYKTVKPHIIFQIEIELNKLTICLVPKKSIIEKSLKHTTFIHSGKIPMKYNHCFVGIRNTINKMKLNDKYLFSKILLIIGRDFAQIKSGISSINTV